MQIDGYKLTYSYNTAVDTWQPHRVATVSEFDSSAGGTLSIEYAHNQTTFTDHNGNVQIMQFNNLGNTVSIQDGQGRAQYAQYAVNNPQTDSGKSNQLMVSSKLQNTVGNRLRYSSVETGSDWTAINASVSVSRSTDTAYSGSYSAKMVRASEGSESGIYSDTLSVGAGQTYTFSAYVKTGSGSVYLGIHDGSTMVTGETVPANSGWTRAQVTYTNTSSATKTVTMRVLTQQAGTSYIDCAQMEVAPTASRYNLIENGDFRYSSTGWTNNGFTVTSLPSTGAPELQIALVKVVGSPSLVRTLTQTVPVSGSKDDTYVLSGWAKGDSAPLSDENRMFSLRAIFNYTDGTTGETVVDFNPDADSSVNWQYAAAPIVAAKAYSSITVVIDYSYNVNTAYFDGIQLYKEEFGNSYTYDSNGNVKSVVDLQKQTTTYQYDTNNNATQILQDNKAKVTYTYDSYHNVKTAVTSEGLSYAFTYDTYGNNLSVAIASGSVVLKSSAAYTTDGNFLSTATDAAGKKTQYSYNENTGVLEWVQYPEDTTATRTSYTYDTMYRMASAAATTDTGSVLNVAYTYTNDMLTQVKTGSTTYTFAYGDFALRSSIKIGSRTLATYSYTNDKNKFLSTLAYGNGDSVNYTYDKYGRVTRQTYEDGSTVSYKYDNSGALATVTDSASGITTTYYYDFTDRLMKYVEKGTSYSHSVGYSYDNLNNLTALVETINGTAHTTSYAYDDDNRITSVTNGSVSKAYTYDANGRISQRVTKNSSTAVLTDTLTYRLPTGTSTTGQISTFKSVASGYNKTYTYTYDGNGNILSVSDGTNTTSYVYDTANQLVRENNQAAGKTWTFSYDDAGNLTDWKTYAYTTGTLGTATATKSYTYGDSAWGDLLTVWNGKTITSDTIGNMLGDGTWTYTWRNGRELATMQSGSTTWTYTYNADGLRTKRTNGTTAYSYVYNGSQLSQMTVGSNTLYFAYDSTGPMSVTYNGTTYYYATNIQGDILAILDSSGAAVVTYTYDAWGNILSVGGSMASTLGAHNPLRYRGYVYDSETGLYYVSSRYYDPEIGRFINADAFPSTGQGLIGNNMFAYCLNNPVNGCDPCGTCFHRWDFWNDCENCGGQTIKDKLIDYYENGLTLNGAVGLYVSANLGIFNVTGSVELAVDLKGNIQIIGSGSFDVTTAGSLSAIGGAAASLYAMPDTSYYAGDTYYIGGSVAVPNPACPAVAVGGGGNVGRTSDGYWGIDGSLGIGTATAVGAEFHGGYSKTAALTNQFNVFEWILSLL